jgi:hypothetical protein
MEQVKEKKVVWQPQPGAQAAYLSCPLPFIGFGGARGGGKTDAVLGRFGVKACEDGKRNMVFFRRELPQADDLIERAKELYLPLGAGYNGMKNQFTFPSGARIRFRPLYSDEDAQKYQGQNMTDAAVEEAGNYPDPSPIMKLFGCLRGSNTPSLTLTFNPGGSGHHWLKQMFIKPAPLGLKVLYMKLPTGKKVPYVYIPSRIQDNKELLKKDPDYINRLHLVGSPELVRAWLEGDFEIHEGSYFPEFGQRHIVQPFPIPKHWNKYLGYDWGFRSPFAAIWGAVSSGKDDAGNEVPYPKGSIVLYRELWGKQVENTEQARKIAEMSNGDKPFCVGDTAIFNEQGGPSIGEQMNKVLQELGHPVLQSADKDRLSGWSQIRQRLMAKPAMLYVFSTCPYFIESLPSLQYDPKKPEDVDSDGDDHIADAARYLCKARLLEPTYKKDVEPMRGGRLELSQLIKQAKANRRKSKI